MWVISENVAKQQWVWQSQYIRAFLFSSWWREYTERDTFEVTE